MRTNIIIEDLLEQAFAEIRARTKKNPVRESPKELIRLRKRKHLAGSIEFHQGLDQKKCRR
jgi:hypothetical protein